MRRGSYDFATTGDNPHPLKILTKEVRREWIGGREFRRVICRPKRNCVIVDVDYLVPLGVRWQLGLQQYCSGLDRRQAEALLRLK